MGAIDFLRPATVVEDGLGSPVSKAMALLPLLEENAAKGEADRRVPDEVIDALANDGVFRLLTPKKYGGQQADLRTLVEVSAVLAEGDGAAAWVATIIAVNGWLTSLFPDAAQDDVFGVDPDARVSGVAAPTGMGRRVEDGWRVTGRWRYNSGAWHANWAVLGTLLTNEEGQVVDQAMVLIPVSELELRDTWSTVGMRATGSNTLIGKDIFVPEYRVLSMPAAAEGDYPTGHVDEALYRSAFGPMLLLCLVGPLIGLASAALQWTAYMARDKPLAFTVHSRQADSVGVQMQVAEAALKIETAGLHLYRAATEVDVAAADGRRLTYADRARIRARAGYCAEQAVEAVNVLLNVHGAGSFNESSPLQLIWRDINIAARHAGLIPAVGYEVFGKALLGSEERPSLMV